MSRRFLLDNDDTNFFCQSMEEDIEGAWMALGAMPGVSWAASRRA